jgi:hypothetical protein
MLSDEIEQFAKMTAMEYNPEMIVCSQFVSHPSKRKD